MNTEEVDFGCGECSGCPQLTALVVLDLQLNSPTSNPDIDLDARDKCDEFASFGDSDANVPIRRIAGCRQCPAKSADISSLALENSYHSRNSFEYLNRNIASSSST